ncbi:hypothetical protein F441_07201 [Phytophthora nicotianae CJ01A1]|uniref:LamG-like jellyroll fold domain-containing protein n=1 Tax=Phytophthora nicotianae CJ01A1 TaxID=1317063 RepID=W2X6Y3_PHYNI|nr:hypothetical protein F441_07201 [Phytophthora nicotianae CJ01A1]
MVLPVSAAVTICSFLTGLDALSLSHSCSFWLQHLNGSPYWQSKLPSLADPLHAVAYKAIYLRSRSLRFSGLIKSGSDSPGIRSSDSYHIPKEKLSRIKDSNFSFDVWFALLPEQPDGAYTGGILYGLQSVHVESRVWPKFHQQFVVISATGDLFCSVIDYRPVVKSKLQLERWYHLALTYEHETQRQDVYLDGEKLRSDTGALHGEMNFLKHEQFNEIIDEFRVWTVVASNLESDCWYHLALTYDNDTQIQYVYLDGVKIHSSAGSLHREWGFLTHEQVGTGCITAGSLNFPHPKYLGWYGFHGVMDDFRIWSGVLLQDDATLLACGGKLPNQRLQ